MIKIIIVIIIISIIIIIIIIIIMKTKIKIKMINDNDNDNKVVQILKLLGQFFLCVCERYSKHLKHKKKHLSNFQPNISISNKASK